MISTRKIKINYNDCDGGGHLKVAAAMRYMQQTSSEQLEDLGIPYEKLYGEQMVFLLAKMSIRIHAPLPAGGAEVVVSTAPIQTKGARYIRDFVVESLEGERLVSALSLWLLADPVSRKILRPSAFPYPIPFSASILEGAVEDIRIPKPDPQSEGRRLLLPVRYSHIDSNRHINNSIYADLVCDLLPFEPLVERGLETLAISYHSEARWGDELELVCHGLGGDAFVCSGTNRGTLCFEAYAKLREG